MNSLEELILSPKITSRLIFNLSDNSISEKKIDHLVG